MKIEPVKYSAFDKGETRGTQIKVTIQVAKEFTLTVAGNRGRRRGQVYCSIVSSLYFFDLQDFHNSLSFVLTQCKTR